jgi:hypothetical protein
LNHDIPNAFFSIQVKVVPLGRQRIAHFLGWDVIVAVHTTYFFNEIVASFYVKAMIRASDQQVLRVAFDAKFQRFQVVFDLSLGKVNAANSLDFGSR